MKFTDAFPREVNAVTLYVVDSVGNVVLSQTESGEALRSGDYLMEINRKDVNPGGHYTLMAWAGDGHNDGAHFTIPAGATHPELTCTLTRERDQADGSAHRRQYVNRLYHGTKADCFFSADQGVHVFEVPLVKNTNELHVVLQHMSGEPVDPDMFNFTVTASNGTMAHDNSLIPDETINYHAWQVRAGTAGIYLPQGGRSAAISAEIPGVNSRALTQMSAAVAHLSYARMVEGHDMRLHVTNAQTGDTVASVPVIDYALLVRPNYSTEMGMPAMGDQEYLDRQDDYSMVFFLDEGNRWINSYIYINSWHVVLQQAEL